MEITNEKLKMCISDAIRNCNRNIYEWMEKTKRGSRFTISHNEIRGLVKNWIIRRLRSEISIAQIDGILRNGNLVISVNDKDNYISSLKFSSYRSNLSYSLMDNQINKFQEIFDSINYSSLKYNPSDYEIDGITPVLPNYGIPSMIDFESISKIKF